MAAAEERLAAVASLEVVSAAKAERNRLRLVSALTAAPSVAAVPPSRRKAVEAASEMKEVEPERRLTQSELEGAPSAAQTGADQRRELAAWLFSKLPAQHHSKRDGPED